jgi:enoyl-CoA hydratase/carnithine racemase
MSGTLIVEERGEVALLTLSNPQKRNALDPPLLDALVAAIADLPKKGVRAAVLAGKDGFFSSGYDISALPDTPFEGDNPLDKALAAITDGDLPLVAALTGPAIGGGCELAAACDLRVAHHRVTLMMPPVKLGLVYSAVGLRRFVALCGASHTRELFLTAGAVDAPHALGWGLVDRVVYVEDVVPTALELAEAIARGAPLAVRGTRRALNRLEAPLPPEVAAELADTQRLAYSSEDAKEARAAFREKRTPHFTGR